MTYRNPFEQPGRFYKGNTHTHSTNSDGQVTAEQRRDAYRQRGYDFLVMTDHRGVTPVEGLSGDGFLTVPGIEVHPPNPYGGELYHIVGIGVSEFIDADRMNANDAITAINAQGGVAVLAHPYWCGHTLSDYHELRGYAAIEVYNTTCCVSIGKGFSESHWDDLLDRVGPTLGLAVDDAHKATADAFKGWIMVKAQELTAPAIVEAIRHGAFYATQGPEIEDLRVVDSAYGPTLRLRTSPAKRVVFKSRTYHGTCFDAVDGALLHSAECTLTPELKYVRVEITAEDGTKAWSNPIFVADYL